MKLWVKENEVVNEKDVNSQLILPISRFFESCKVLRLGGHVALCGVTKLIGGEEMVVVVWESLGYFH